jgi:hypothetical protein
MLTQQHYAVIDLPLIEPEVMETFSDLPLDPYTGGKQRYRRFSQFRLDRGDDGWVATRLPYRPFIQPRSVNSLVGGMQRPFEPFLIDPSRQLAAGAEAIGLDPVHPWQVNVHQCRVITSAEIAGVSVPEGPHRDGHDFGMLAVWSRENITGGVSQLMPTGGGEPFFIHTLLPGQALIYDDGKMWHHATDIEPRDARPGHRDLWIVAFNRWDRRKYGEEFERDALVAR